MGLTVSQVAKLSGVSVRTLHHYDEIGLLPPSARTEAGYRLYGEGDLQRLQQILFFKELEFPLEQISRIVTDPAFDLQAALLMQRQLLTEKATKVRALLSAVETALESIERGTGMNQEEMFEVFGNFDPTKYEAEAQQRWGETDAYRESARRTNKYGKAEWMKIKAEGEAVLASFARAMTEGKRPDSPDAMGLAEEARLQIDRWFYPCSRQLHRSLGQMYVADPRFAEHYERVRPGLAQYVHDAILANSQRQ